MIRIQTFQSSSADFSQTINLEGTLYRLRMTWNTRNSAWYMDIRDNTLNDILLGLRLAPNTLLIKDYADSRLPPGDFYLWDSEKTPVNYGVTFATLNERYLLLYLTEAELQDAL